MLPLRTQLSTRSEEAVLEVCGGDRWKARWQTRGWLVCSAREDQEGDEEERGEGARHV